MIKQTIAKLMSDQVNAEYYSAYLYLSMSAYADNKGLKGFANWFFIQAQEEMAHGTRIYQYLLERGSALTFSEIQGVPAEYGDMLSIFEQVLSHENHVSERINNIATIALKEQDHAAYHFIQWFVNEQVEEESTAEGLIQKLKMIGDNNSILINLDREMEARVFVNPFPNTTI